MSVHGLKVNQKDEDLLLAMKVLKGKLFYFGAPDNSRKHIMAGELVNGKPPNLKRFFATEVYDQLLVLPPVERLIDVVDEHETVIMAIIEEPGTNDRYYAYMDRKMKPSVWALYTVLEDGVKNKTSISYRGMALPI